MSVEMGEEACGNCRSWEEDIYWNHFQCHQFSQILQDGFDRHLAIPEQFIKNLRKKLPKTVSLKGPSGGAWQVGLTTIDDAVFFNHGWDEFVKDHFLQENDLLIFKYNGDSCFDVLIFDGLSLCEKAASYFVRKCGHKDQGSGCQTKRKIQENLTEGTLPSPGDVTGDPPPEKSANNDIDTTPLAQHITSRATTKKIRRQIDLTNHVNEDHSSSAEEIETKPDIDHLNASGVQAVPYISSRRLVTEEEKQNALLSAQKTLTRDGFLVVMKPTHVYRRFYMSLPSSWMFKHVKKLEKQDVVLRINEYTWYTQFYYQKSKHSGGLSRGWRIFATDNDLQEFDVCVFEPGTGSPIDGAIVLDVNIFRVHQEEEDM